MLNGAASAVRAVLAGSSLVSFSLLARWLAGVVLLEIRVAKNSAVSASGARLACPGVACERGGGGARCCHNWAGQLRVIVGVCWRVRVF